MIVFEPVIAFNSLIKFDLLNVSLIEKKNHNLLTRLQEGQNYYMFLNSNNAAKKITRHSIGISLYKIVSRHWISYWQMIFVQFFEFHVFYRPDLQHF